MEMQSLVISCGIDPRIEEVFQKQRYSLEKQTQPKNVRALDLTLVPSSSLDATDWEEVNEEAPETGIPRTDGVKVEPETEGLD
ncbi:hypothetical protein RJ639_040140 [Escallonia herrerae]|uniref:Uncharacterized protein n=1 Tax=Escallonia herrerae TaxID=1293975 RepID=A0AA88WM04_9ASTE|nr:hypothetical protein RJ639_040140 [Escallonia herrerae]